MRRTRKMDERHYGEEEEWKKHDKEGGRYRGTEKSQENGSNVERKENRVRVR